jgi:hypothetical protein
MTRRTQLGLLLLVVSCGGAMSTGGLDGGAAGSDGGADGGADGGCPPTCSFPECCRDPVTNACVTQNFTNTECPAAMSPGNQCVNCTVLPDASVCGLMVGGAYQCY